MKKTFLVSILVINTLITFGQYKSVTKVKLFMVKWDARYTITRDIDNIRKQYLYSFTMVDGSLVDLFSDYADCKIKLNSQDTINYKYNYCNICAEIFFRRKKVIIYFLDSISKMSS